MERRTFETRLRMMVDTAPVCLMHVAGDGTILAMNVNTLDMVDAERADQVVDQSWHKLGALENSLSGAEAENQRLVARHEAERAEWQQRLAAAIEATTAAEENARTRRAEVERLHAQRRSSQRQWQLTLEEIRVRLVLAINHEARLGSTGRCNSGQCISQAGIAERLVRSGVEASCDRVQISLGIRRRGGPSRESLPE